MPSARAPAVIFTCMAWRVVVAVNCSVRVSSSCTGRPQAEDGEGHDVFDQHLLLAAEAAADAAADDADPGRG